jgi:hypothetical protein
VEEEDKEVEEEDKEIYLTDYRNGRKFYWNPSGRKAYICEEQSCKNVAKIQEFCRKHKDSIKTYVIKKPKITEVVESGKIYQYMLLGDVLYKRPFDGQRWFRTCNFTGYKCTSFAERTKVGKDYCKRHKNNIDHTKIKTLKAVITNKNQNFRNKCKNSMRIGDATEIYCYNDIVGLTEIENATRIGQTGDKSDIIYKFRDESFYRGVQVKTLLKERKEDNYSFSHCNNYDNNLLIIAYNQERTRFFLIMSNCIGAGVTLQFGSQRSRFKDNMFTDKNIFLERLKVMLR